MIFGRDRNKDKLVLTPDEDSIAVNEPKKLSADELLIQSVKKFRQEMREVVKQSKEEREESLKEDKKRIQSAEKIVGGTGLGKALTTIYQQMYHWPSWCKMPDYSGHEELGVSDVSGEKPEYVLVEKINNLVVFRFQGQEFCIVFSDKSSSMFDDFSWGKISLYADEHKVMSIDVSQKSHQEYDTWSYDRVTVIETGPWISHVVQIEEEIHMAKQRADDEWKSDRIKKQAENLPEPTES